jgi:hypothetical protein
VSALAHANLDVRIVGGFAVVQASISRAQGYLDVATLRARYIDEFRPYATGRKSWHDQTLQLWIEAYLSDER